tara:strand:+ start:3384 stop:3674 length:291 start_codon:yes stop_codon:yes gene_type:complete
MANEIKFNLDIMAFPDIESMHKVIDAYRELDDNEYIFETGFNTSSGYVYIALENGISICSCFGQDVEYLVTSFESGKEYFFDSYAEGEIAVESFCK